MSALEDLLAKSGLPEAGLATFKTAFDEAYNLTIQNNKWVAQINAAKASDPNNVDYLDSLWKAEAKNHPEFAAIEEQFDAVAEEYEKLLKQLREFGKTQIQEALSEEDQKKVREQVNQAAPTIKTAAEKAANMAEMVESFMKPMGIELPEGGLMSFLPDVEPLKNARGRKATTQAGGIGTYMTRTGGILIDGVSTNVNGKGKFNYGADKISDLFGANIHPENRVSAEELEEAFFKALPGSPETRSIKSTEIPESFEFEFSKTIKVQNKNDDSFTELPKTVKVTVLRAEPTFAKKAEGTETAKSDEKVETQEAPKVETKTEVPAPAKKTTAPAKK